VEGAPAGERDEFRSLLSVDDATWMRSRGWVVHQAAVALAYYTEDNNSTLVRETRRWVGEVL
jgi:hypothetical protein